MNKKLMIVYLGILAAMAPLATDMYLPALPELQAELGSTTSMTQLTLTMTMMGMALGQIFAGPVSDLRGRRLPLLLGMLIFAGASLVCVFANNIYVLLAARLIQGLAGACGIVIARAIARDVCRGAELTTFYAVLMMVNGLAPILAPVIGGQILLFSTWHGIFIVLAGIGVAMAAATLVYRETLPVEKRIRSVGATLRVLPRLLQNRYFMGHCLVQSFVFMSFFCYIGSSSFIFQGIYGVSAQEYSLIFGGIGVGMLLLGYVPARLAGRVSEASMLFASMLVQLVGSILLLGAFLTGYSPLWLVILLLCCCFMPISIIGAVSFSLALSGQGGNAGSASALLGFFSMFLGGAMMPAAGFFGTDTGVPMAAIMLIGFVCGMLCYVVMIRPEHREKA